MRVSVDSNDPGYANYRGGGYRVTLDGKEISHVVTADEEAGEVIRCCTDDSGNLLPPLGDALQREKLRGVVVISKAQR